MNSQSILESDFYIKQTFLVTILPYFQADVFNFIGLVNRLAKLAENVRGAAEKISTIKKVLDPAVEI